MVSIILPSKMHNTNCYFSYYNIAYNTRLVVLPTPIPESTIILPLPIGKGTMKMSTLHSIKLHMIYLS